MRHGPSPVLTEEESELISWVVKMAEIGYGQTRIQVTEMVKKILDRTGRPNPFQDNRPGKDWWYMFLHRHPKVSLKTPQALQICRASSYLTKSGMQTKVGFLCVLSQERYLLLREKSMPIM